MMSQDPGPRPGQSSLRHIPPRLGSLVQRSALLALGRRSLLLCNHSRHGRLHLSETGLGCIGTGRHQGGAHSSVSGVAREDPQTLANPL